MRCRLKCWAQLARRRRAYWIPQQQVLCHEPHSGPVKKGQKKTAPQNAAVQPRVKQAHPKRELKNVEITGIGTEGKIQVITTKLVSVFATKFAPSLEADTLYNYLIEKLGNETVTCCRMESAHSRFGSFQITCECANICYVQPTTLACWNIYTPVL